MLGEGVAEGPLHGAEEIPIAAEPHLCLGGVDVDIHRLRGQGDVEDGYGVASFGKELPIEVVQGVGSGGHLPLQMALGYDVDLAGGRSRFLVTQVTHAGSVGVNRRVISEHHGVAGGRVLEVIEDSLVLHES